MEVWQSGVGSANWGGRRSRSLPCLSKKRGDKYGHPSLAAAERMGQPTVRKDELVLARELLELVHEISVIAFRVNAVRKLLSIDSRDAGLISHGI